jgi:putative transcriptional regulator
MRDVEKGERWFEGYLRSLLVRSPDLVDDHIQQRRSCGPHRGGEKDDKVCAGQRTEGTGEKANCASGDPEEEGTVMAKRNILIELMEGVASMKSHREGKLTLRSYKVEPAPFPKVDSKLIKDTRERLHCSRAVFARKLRINERTLEKWEQGRAKPNPQAAALVLLVRKYPDTLKRLESVAAG